MQETSESETSFFNHDSGTTLKISSIPVAVIDSTPGWCRLLHLCVFHMYQVKGLLKAQAERASTPNLPSFF